MSPVVDLTPAVGATLGAAGATGSLAALASLAAMLLALVFATAAVTKLIAPKAAASEFSDLGLPSPGLLARLVPAVELTVAAALIVRPPLGATAAAILLCAFTAVLIATIRSGRTVSCGCLGALSRQPVTAATVARNFAFLAMTGLAAAVPSLSVPDLPAVMVMTLSCALAGLVVQLMATRQTIGRIWSVELAGERIDLTDGGAHG